MNSVDKQYLSLLKEVRENGIKKSDRTGTGTVSLFGRTLRFDMREGFPLLTTKKIHTKSVIHELLWFLKGSHNIKYLVDNDVNIWNEWPWQAYMKERESRESMLATAVKNADMYEDTPFAVAHMKQRLDEHPPLTIKEFVEKIKASDLSPMFSSTKDSFTDVWGELGPVYGKQWRQWQGQMEYKKDNKESRYGSLWYDQILRLVQDLKTNPDSRRLMVNAWNVAEIDQMLLPPCHYGFQCWTRELSIEERCKIYIDRNPDKTNDGILNYEWIGNNLCSHEDYDKWNIPKRALSLMWQQRSVDLFLGLPFNIASYGLLLEMLAQSTNMVAEELVFNGGDCHIYSNHFEQVDLQLSRDSFELCKLKLTKPKDTVSSLHGTNGHIIEYKYEDFEFVNYNSHPAIKAPIAI